MFGIKRDSKNNPVVIELKTVPVEDKVSTSSSVGKKISELNQIYRQVPQTRCNQCGTCCEKIGVPLVYSIEYLNMMQYLNSPSNKDTKIRIHAIAMKGKALLEQKRKEDGSDNNEINPLMMRWCPALDPKTRLCSIYESRPLNCRVYGLDRWYKKKSQDWTRETGQSVCFQVKISEEDRTEQWNGKESINSFYEQLNQLSTYPYIDEEKNTIYNVSPILAWFI